MQKIKIYTLLRSGQIKAVKILRSSLSNYIKSRYKKDGKIVWAKPDILKKVYEKYKPKKLKIGYTNTKGRTQMMNKLFSRYEFKLWRKKLIIEADVEPLMKNLIKKFKKIRNNDPELGAVRLGLALGTDKKEKVKFTNKDTGRKKSKEIKDTISTMTYERGIKSEEMMFIELRDKLLKIFFKEKGYTINLDDDDVNLEALIFYVFFVEP